MIWEKIDKLQQPHSQCLNDALVINNATRDPFWTESLTVGSEVFVDEIQALHSSKARNRTVTNDGDDYVLHEMPKPYNVSFRVKKTV